MYKYNIKLQKVSHIAMY